MSLYKCSQLIAIIAPTQSASQLDSDQLVRLAATGEVYTYLSNYYEDYTRSKDIKETYRGLTRKVSPSA